MTRPLQKVTRYIWLDAVTGQRRQSARIEHIRAADPSSWLEELACGHLHQPRPYNGFLSVAQRRDCKQCAALLGVAE